MIGFQDIFDADAVRSQMAEVIQDLSDAPVTWAADAQGGSYDHYSDQENIPVTEDTERVRLHSAEKQFVRKTARDMVFTPDFGGTSDSINQISVSRHFMADSPGSIGAMEYFSVHNDHLTDGSRAQGAYSKPASDHGQIIAHLHLREG